ncbi:hypothetical protein BDF21DRAFT_331557 [Thamnidium elegans]|nr:hypothetical protein BDF21DRAFT_331557 [Thamnidium elegans]
MFAYFIFLCVEAAEGVPAQRTAARQKLSRLNNLQFHELATDVYDELVRRNVDGHKSFLPLRDDFHPRRNQARQKLATLPDTRFKDLASDVYHELKRRYPHLLEEELPPMPQSKSIDAKAHPSQSTNIVPVKGTINVESVDYSDDEGSGGGGGGGGGSGGGGSNGNIQSLDSLMADLGNMVKTPRPDTNNNNNTSESDRDTQSRMKKMQEEYRQLDDKYARLNKEHKEQQVAVREVKDEIKQLIDELKNLSTKNETLRIQNENADIKIRNLTEESKNWKTKYDNINVELRSFKVRSIHIDHQDISKEFFLKPIPNGAIGHQYIIEYQTAIDELMKTSRSSKPADVLFSMRTIVMTCKSITTEVEDYELKVGLSPADQTSLYDIKKRFSTELSNLLASAKYYAGGMGISPVSLVDAAAGNLTVTIVDLVKLLGMRPVHDTMQPTKNNNFAPTVNPNMNHHSMNHNMNHSTSPNMSYPTSPNMNHPMIETDHIVCSVQNLLTALRSNDGNLFKIITSIIDIVSNIVHVSKGTFAGGEGLKYRNQGNIILSDLDRCNSKIVQIRDTDFAATPENANAVAKRNLAQESYEIAKYTKELINMLDM